MYYSTDSEREREEEKIMYYSTDSEREEEEKKKNDRTAGGE